jgi:hypothetical protein
VTVLRHLAGKAGLASEPEQFRFLMVVKNETKHSHRAIAA